MASLAPFSSMFQAVADILNARDMHTPAVGYPSLIKGWKEEAEQEMEATLQDGEVTLTRKEELSLQVAKEVAFAAFDKFFETATAVAWGAQPASVRQEAVAALLRRPQVPQRTAEWYLQGKQVLTASEFATLFKSPRAVGQLVQSKVLPVEPIDAVTTTHRLACMTCEMTPFDWGIRFEPVVKQVLEAEGCTLAEAGRLLHPTDALLAASPDALILTATDARRTGRLIEIKCPISRAVGDEVPFDYWCQMQVQMEVTGIGECEYVEVKLQSVQKHETALPEGVIPDGWIWLFQDPKTTIMKYAYTEAEKVAAEADGLDLLESIPWRVEKLHRVLVVRDRAWFAETTAARKKFWEDVASARAGSFVVPESSRRAPARSASGTVIVHKEDAAPPVTYMLLDD